MIEAVGEEYWPTYFATIDSAARARRPGRDPGDHDAARPAAAPPGDTYGWIHKYIFPGGLIPSLQAIERDAAPAHVAARRRTPRAGPALRRDAAAVARAVHRQLGARPRSWGSTTAFRRMWEFYLAYCEAGFRTGYLGVSQLAMVEPPASSAH